MNTNRPQYEGWISVFETGTDYEADLVRDRLDSEGIPAVVFTQRDHAFNLTVGDLAAVHVMVPPDFAGRAASLLENETFTDLELDEAAMTSDPNAPPAHSPSEETHLDSGIEEIHLDVPDEDEEEDERSP